MLFSLQFNSPQALLALKKRKHMTTRMTEIISWKIISEFMRRYGDYFNIIETHPCSGQYDCISVFDKLGKHILDINRGGGLHLWSKANSQNQSGSGISDSYHDVWQDYQSDPKQTFDKICRMAGLPTDVVMPVSSSVILTYRFISTFLIQAVLGLDKWECRNGYLDSSGYSFGPVKDFQHFPSAERRLREREKNDLNEEPAYRFWFLKKNGVSKVCLETNGHVWTHDGGEYFLAEMYKVKRKMLRLVSKIGGQYLP